MNDASRPTVVRVPRRVRAALGAFAVAAFLTGAAVWAVGASADVGGGGGTAGAARPLCTPPSACGTSPPPTSGPPPSSSGPSSTRTSYQWTFEDGLPGGWYGVNGNGGLAPWIAPSPGAAASGRTGLLVGGASGY